MGPAIVRQWLILSMLPRPPRRIDTGTMELRLRERGHDAHRRTIQRDLVQLSAVFPIIADERQKPFGWRWSENAPCLFPSVHLDERERRRARLRLRLFGSDPRAVLEALCAGDAAIEPATAIVTCSVEDSVRTRRVLLGLADVAEVLEPTAWRRELAERAARAAALYGRRT